jgi:two-component system response regulator ChvI
MLKTNDESIQISMLFDDNSNNTDSTSSKVRDDIKVEEITFSDKSQSYCVCFVSMVDSIGFTFQIKDSEKIRKYYSIFINTMAAISRNFGAKIIKNTGTSLVYFFPKTSSTGDNQSAFRDVLECGITMIAASDVINEKLREEGGMPPLYYRISADYGRVEVARSISSPDTDDLFGTTMNICSKINSMAPQNGMVIGSDLYDYCRARKSSSTSLFEDCDDDINGYDFKRIGEYSIAGPNNPYSVYSVLVSKNRLDTTITPINKSLNSYSDHEYEQQLQQKNAHNILLVDDEPDTLFTYKTFLLYIEGYNVDAFTDSQKALQNFAQVNPSYYDLVVMDIRMPGLNGLQLYYRIKAMNPDIKVLFVSALDAAKEMVSILPGVKIEDVIQKPVNQEHFSNKVKATLA